jgi:hypothetical protein
MSAGSSARWGLAALLACAFLGCKVDKQAFQVKVFGCNPNAADPACGTDNDNNAMACVPAYQLGGRNFCASGCNVLNTPPETADAICLPSGPRNAGAVSGAHLPRCNPGVENDCGREELSCLRTDLLVDEGVCTTVGSCKNDGDCRDPVRAKCMGSLLRENYSQAELKADHTYCLQFGCKERRTACSPGETCLRDVLSAASTPSDICVPNCDANRNCPPNYFCFPDLYSRSSAPVCIPGLLGLRCRSRLDCLFGDCVAARDLTDPPDPELCRDPAAAVDPAQPAPTKPGCDLGFNICTVGCQSDEDCMKYDSEQGTLFCSKRADGTGFCTGARAFRGAACTTQSDCLYPGEICAFGAPDIPTGQCLQPCAPFAQCPSYGGVPHVCRPQFMPNTRNLDLAHDPWVCWPGAFGQLCGDTPHCLAGLQCLSASPTNPLFKTCTIACNTDDDCGTNRYTANGWCQPALHICVDVLADDDPTCDRDRQCASKKCLAVNGARKCAKTPGY